MADNIVLLKMECLSLDDASQDAATAEFSAPPTSRSAPPPKSEPDPGLGLALQAHASGPFPTLPGLFFASIAAARAYDAPRTFVSVVDDDCPPDDAPAHVHQDWVKQLMDALTAPYPTSTPRLVKRRHKRMWEEWQDEYRDEVIKQLAHPDRRKVAEKRIWHLYDEILKLHRFGIHAGVDIRTDGVWTHPLSFSVRVRMIAGYLQVNHQAMPYNMQ